MKFNEERWERIQLFAAANKLTPQRFVEGCIDAMCLAKLQTEGAVVIERGVENMKAAERRKERAKLKKASDTGKLTHSLGDQLKGLKVEEP